MTVAGLQVPDRIPFAPATRGAAIFSILSECLQVGLSKKPFGLSVHCVPEIGGAMIATGVY